MGETSVRNPLIIDLQSLLLEEKCETKLYKPLNFAGR